MQIEFGNASESVLHEYEVLTLSKSCNVINSSNWDGLLSLEIPNSYSTSKLLHVHKYFFDSPTLADPNYFVKELTIRNSTKHPKTIHIQKIVYGLGGSTIHPFVLLPNVTITIKFPTVYKDVRNHFGTVMSTYPTSANSFTGHMLIVATPVFVAGTATGKSTLESGGLSRRLFYNRLFEYKGDDLSQVSGLQLTQNVVVDQNKTLDLNNAISSPYMYHSVRSNYSDGFNHDSLFSPGQFSTLDLCPFEAVPIGIDSSKTLLLPDVCTKTVLRNSMILEFFLPDRNASTMAIEIDHAYYRENSTSSTYRRKTYIKTEAVVKNMKYGTLVIPCSYKPDYHFKIARIITKITM